MNFLTRFITGALVVTAALYFSMIVQAAAENAGISVEPGSLDDKVGFYTLEDGRRVLMTYSVKGGMSLYHLDDGFFRWRNDLARHIYPGNGDQYVWEMNEGLPDRSLRFQYDSTGEIIGFSWASESGESGTVARDNDPPYVIKEVSFFNGDTELSGTLLIPPDGSITGGAVMIHGSGDSHRDNLWYFIIADRLAKAGLVTLLPDKRGSGKSKGEWEVASFADFAGDAIAGVNVVKATAAVPGDQVGLVGISQGGWIAPLAADMDQSIAYVINLSGAVVTPSDQLKHEVGGTFAAFVAKLRRWTWWKKNGDFDPVPYWTSNPQPGLIMYGIEDEDDNVPVIKSTGIIKDIQRKRDDLALIVYQGVGHSLAIPETSEMIFLDDMINWIHELSANDNDNGSAAAQSSAFSEESTLCCSEKEMTYANGDVVLAGILLTPKTGSPFPAAVLLQGSGTSDRSNDWARLIAETLVEDGVAVLLTDKRGSGKSGGDWRVSDFEDLARNDLAGGKII